jgi:hypothetical protein
MSEATSGSSFQGSKRELNCHEYGFQDGLPSKGLTGARISNGVTVAGCLLRFVRRLSLLCGSPTLFQRNLPLPLVDTLTDFPANAAV